MRTENRGDGAALAGGAVFCRGAQVSGASFRAFLGDALRCMGILLGPEAFDLLDRFRELVVRADQSHNLTTLTGDFDFAVKHVSDALSLLRVGILDGAGGAGQGRLIDVGAGAGVPGIPLKIARPGLDVTLLDSSEKRASFLRTTIRDLGLSDCRVLEARAEDAGHVPGTREAYDLVVTRAVAKSAVDVEYAVPLLCLGGRYVAMKGPRAREELEAAERAGGALGADVERVVPLRLPLTGEERLLIVFRKNRPTPSRYPRRAGVPAKRPLA